VPGAEDNLKTETMKAAAGTTEQPIDPTLSVPAPKPTEGSQDDAAVIAKKDQIRVLWAENLTVQARNRLNRYELGKALDELHVLRAHHGNGTYDDDVRAIGISKPTAWRIRNFYRELADLAPVPQFVSPETNSTIATVAAGDSNVAMEVRSTLINEGFKRADVDKVELDAAWDFAEAYRNAHRQLRPGPNGATTAGTGSSTGTTQPTGAGRSAADVLRDRAKKTKRITQVRLEPARHEIFHEALAKWAAALGTGTDSETIFQIVTTCEVPPCAK
jgi:hypothetical protein